MNFEKNLKLPVRKMQGMPMREMSSVRWTEEEKRQGKAEGTRLYQLSYNLNIFNNLDTPWFPFVFNYNNYLFFLIELKNSNRFSIDYHSTWDGILPQ